jgi:hypothetical protein
LYNGNEQDRSTMNSLCFPGQAVAHRERKSMSMIGSSQLHNYSIAKPLRTQDRHPKPYQKPFVKIDVVKIVYCYRPPPYECLNYTSTGVDVKALPFSFLKLKFSPGDCIDLIREKVHKRFYGTFLEDEDLKKEMEERNVIPFFYFLLKQKSKVVIQSDEDFMETFPQFVNSKTDDKMYVGVKWFTTFGI